MASNELPPTGMGSSKSVFRERHDDVEVLKTVNAAHKKKTHRRDSLECINAVITPVIPEHPRKMKVNIPENSTLAIQSFGNGQSVAPSPGEPPSETGQLKQPEGCFSRPNSKAQGEELEDYFDTHRILHKFNSSMAKSTGALMYGHKRQNLYKTSDRTTAHDTNTPNTFTVSKGLPRPQSTSDLGKLKESYVDSILNQQAQNSGILTRYLDCWGSTGNIMMSAINDEPISDTPISDTLISDTLILDTPISNTSLPPEKLENSAVLWNSTSTPALLKMPIKDIIDGPSSVDAPIITGGSSLGLLSRTRQFGAWLTKATDGERVEVSQTDLNAVAPTSF